MTRTTAFQLLCLGAAAFLAGCDGRQGPPVIERDQTDFNPGDFDRAVLAADPPRPVKILEVPKPLPLPGQLKPRPDRKEALKPVENQASAMRPKDHIAAAQQAAKFEPQADSYINAIQVYPYWEGALYQLYAAPEKVSDIALQAGEKVLAVSAGDTLRWVVGDVVSGSGEAARAHVLVKPSKEDLKTNLVIITDRRVYHLELTSTPETYMASLSWRYPQDELIALKRSNQRAEAAADTIADQDLNLDQLRFGYRIIGDEASWRPLLAFDDGKKVYIQFPARLDQGEAPPLFILGSKGQTQLVNYRVKGRYYIVDRLFAAAELRLGEAPQKVVRITRRDDLSSAAQLKRHEGFSVNDPAAFGHGMHP